jgi:hypothetical protein
VNLICRLLGHKGEWTETHGYEHLHGYTYAHRKCTRCGAHEWRSWCDQPENHIHVKP